ncbi:unnamed protein product [Oppiella nova]|uniref:CLIP1 zinc knuckle domain-containing protein n=1 Tax=Oppiella nova TaxID=334625 RepID=A0A7R9MDH6_9ACAR|nr:unnamed protein product [Oppiella nova]CAG2175186.1 unnamed protein product [Oppiella nova]
MREEFDKYRCDLEKKLADTAETTGALQELGTDLDRQRKQCHDVEDENQSLKDDNRHLRQKVEELRDDIEALDKRHREVLQEFEYECERLSGKAESAAQLADDRERQLRDVEEQQQVAIDVFRRQADVEKRQLEATLNELEVRVRESILENARRRDRSPSPGREGSDGYEQQIEFLNSVIVDMQKKNDELRCRVQVLEEIGLDEFDSSFHQTVTNGGNGSPTTPRRTNGHIRAPRKFCDICDVFDSHETEDCPQQSDAYQETTAHSYYRASRTEHRPYCLQCEKFGHNTEHCPDAETF